MFRVIRCSHYLLLLQHEYYFISTFPRQRPFAIYIHYTSQNFFIMQYHNTISAMCLSHNLYNYPFSIKNHHQSCVLCYYEVKHKMFFQSKCYREMLWTWWVCLWYMWV